MKERRVLVIPENWIKEASTQLAEWNGLGPFYEAVATADSEAMSRARLRNSIIKSLRNSDASSAVVVLPTSFAKGASVRYWPDMVIPNKSGLLITSIVFADNWTACREIINRSKDVDDAASRTHNVTCQYQPPYTHMLGQWTKGGARGFHPGDFFKQEFLQELGNMRGHWLYWGHADSAKLHGYSHLSTGDILHNKPVLPLQSTIWFSCSTLDIRERSNIALDWYLSGATHCMLASTCPVNTADNQELGTAWLEALQAPGVKTIADIIQHLLSLDQKAFEQVLSPYRLLGLPWVRFI